MKRAIQYFHQYRVTTTTSELYADLEMKIPAGTQTSFQMDFGQDVRRATRITFDIFDQVYQLPGGFELLIKEN